MFVQNLQLRSYLFIFRGMIDGSVDCFVLTLIFRFPFLPCSDKLATSYCVSIFKVSFLQVSFGFNRIN